MTETAKSVELETITAEPAGSIESESMDSQQESVQERMQERIQEERVEQQTDLALERTSTSGISIPVDPQLRRQLIEELDSVIQLLKK